MSLIGMIIFLLVSRLKKNYLGFWHVNLSILGLLKRFKKVSKVELYSYAQVRLETFDSFNVWLVNIVHSCTLYTTETFPLVVYIDPDWT